MSLAVYPELEVLQPVAVEKRLKAKVGEDGPLIVGVIDRVDRTGTGRLCIADYKTGKAPPVDKYGEAAQQRINAEKVGRPLPQGTC